MKNDPNHLPPIPTPPSAVWREFRIRVIPFVVFFVVVAGAAFMWKTMPMGGNLRGVGEGLRSVVTSPRIGVLQEVQVQPFQWVEAGEPLVTLLPSDPAAQLDLLGSELQLARLRLEPSTADRNAMNYEQVRIDALRLKGEVALARVNLERAESALKRNEAQLTNRLVSRDDYEISLRDRDFYDAEVKVKSASLQEIESSLERLRALGEPQSPGTNLMTSALISRLESRIGMVETNWNPITLRAPISGRVHLIARGPGEYVVEGEPLVMIASPKADRIVAYMRQPFSFEPQAGMEVDVLLQNQQRQKFTTKIQEVGAQLEAITNALAFVQQGALVDMGLPIIISVPPNVSLRPGETVNITRRSQGFSLPGGKLAKAAAAAEPSAPVRR